jgi:hypothetical protein
VEGAVPAVFYRSVQGFFPDKIVVCDFGNLPMFAEATLSCPQAHSATRTPSTTSKQPDKIEVPNIPLTTVFEDSAFCASARTEACVRSGYAPGGYVMQRPEYTPG